jgi:hypothetical protein
MRFGRKNHTGGNFRKKFSAPVLKFCPFMSIKRYVAAPTPVILASGRGLRLVFAVFAVAASALLPRNTYSVVFLFCRLSRGIPAYRRSGSDDI